MFRKTLLSNRNKIISLYQKSLCSRKLSTQKQLEQLTKPTNSTNCTNCTNKEIYDKLNSIQTEITELHTYVLMFGTFGIIILSLSK